MNLGLTLPLASCDPLVEALAAFVAGEGEGHERAAITQHLDRCGRCRDEYAAVTALRGQLLGAAPVEGETDRTATEAGWGRLAAALDGVAQESPVTISSAAHPAVVAQPEPIERTTTPLPRRRPWRSWIGAAAAAGFIGLTAWGVASFDDTTDRGRSPDLAATAPRILQGAMARTDDPAAAPIAGLTTGTQAVALSDGATVRSAALWTAALRAGTTITATSHNTVAVANGEAVWHVVPQRGGLVVTTPHATVRVLGTLFSVQVEGDRTVVAVYDGRVRVQGADTANTVDGGRAVAVTGKGAPTLLALAPAPPEWLRPAKALTAQLTALGRAGRTSRVRFTLSNPGPGLCVLVAPNARDPHFSLTAVRTDPGTSATPATLQRLSVQAAPGQRGALGGRVLLGPGEHYTVECNVAAALPEAGHYRLTGRYAVAGNVPAGTFVGRVESAPVDVEVTR